MFSLSNRIYDSTDNFKNESLSKLTLYTKAAHLKKLIKIEVLYIIPERQHYVSAELSYFKFFSRQKHLPPVKRTV